MTKNSKKNLQDTKKSSTFATEKRPVFEIVSSEPCSVWKPKEAMSIREMLIRTERGQRIDVHTRFRSENIPDNMYFAEYENVRMPDGSIEKRVKHDDLEDSFDHTPPDGVVDIVDVMNLQEETKQRKEEFRKNHEKKTVANAASRVPGSENDPGNDKGPGDEQKDTTKE